MRAPHSRREIETLAAMYDLVTDAPMVELLSAVKRRGHLTRSDLAVVSEWKSKQRVLWLVQRNAEADVEEFTRCGLVSQSERLRIHSLLGLQGVSWPTASVILHWFHRDRYPILDVRAIESLGLAQPSSYSFQFWWSYVERCRDLAESAGVSMRVLDRALWQFSKNEGGPGSA